METKKSTSGRDLVNGDRFQAKGKDVFTRNSKGYRGRRPGLVSALIRHYVRCSGVTLEKLQGSNTSA
jgi:hypothetical protein